MSSVADFNGDSGFSDVIRIEEGKIRSHVEEVVRQSVEQTLNGLLDAEADRLGLRKGDRRVYAWLDHLGRRIREQKRGHCTLVDELDDNTSRCGTVRST
ncbi:MAG: hypothetical protein U1D30_11940 [Planctomycetota bacterium]